MGFWGGKKVAVTGGAGFIGSYLAEMLVDAGAKVRIIDNLSRGKLENLKSVQPHIEFVENDLRDNLLARTSLLNQEIVFNLAAKVAGIQYNISHNADMFEQNMLLQMQPIAAAAKGSVETFLQVSTACIYPHDAAVPTSEEEGDRGEPEPTNVGYGWAKRMGERLARYYHDETDMIVLVARPFNAYGGARDYYDEATSHVIPAMVKKVLDRDDPVMVWGSGNQSRVFVHAKDIARGMMLMVEKHDAPDPVNLGHDRETTIRELVKKIQELTGISRKVFYDTSKPEGYLRRAANVDNLRKITGFVPEITLEEGLREAIECYKKLQTS